MTRVINAKLEGQYRTIKKEGSILPLYYIQNGDVTVEGIGEDSFKTLINVASIAQKIEKNQLSIQKDKIRVVLKTDLINMEQVEKGLWSAVMNTGELGIEDEELDELVELGQAILGLF